MAFAALAASAGEPPAPGTAVPALPEARQAPTEDFADDQPQLAIAGASYDPATRRLTISGEGFGTHRLPSVKLDGDDLPLARASDGLLLTDPLGKDPAQGSHLVTVVAGNDRSRFDVFNLTVGVSAGDGASAAPTGPQPNRVGALDRIGDVGWATATAVGTDGKPLVIYLDYTKRDLKLAICQDPACVRAEASPAWTPRETWVGTTRSRSRPTACRP